jgi:hypothetical protein
MAIGGMPNGAIRQQHDLHKPHDLGVFAENRRPSEGRLDPDTRK